MLVYGTYKLLAEEDSAIYAYTRTLEGKTAVVICNMSPKNQTFEFPSDSESSFSNREVLIHNYPLDKNGTLENVRCTHMKHVYTYFHKQVEQPIAQF